MGACKQDNGSCSGAREDLPCLKGSYRGVRQFVQDRAGQGDAGAGAVGAGQAGGGEGGLQNGRSWQRRLQF